MRMLDLFSGIGAFSLGLGRAGMQTIAFCEIDPFCRRVLAKHWPEVHCYHDVRELSAQHLIADGHSDIDLICGGFPCQDISAAGRGAGIAGERSGLWREFARLIGEVGPRYVIVENVAALLGRGLGDVLGDLASLGYDAEWHCIPASAVGAPHIRDRIWIVAHSGGAGLSFPRSIEDGTHRIVCWRAIAASDWWTAEPDVGRMAHGVASRVDRLRGLGNSLVPQIPELIGRAILAREAML